MESLKKKKEKIVEKNPLCIYDGFPEEIREGDTIPLKKMPQDKEAGVFTVPPNPIPGNSTYTLQIPLAHNQFKMGQLILCVISPPLPYTFANILFTDVESFAISIAYGKNYSTGEEWARGYVYAAHSRLSDPYFDDEPNPSSIRIDSCYISGDKIMLRFRNVQSVFRTLAMSLGRFLVYK